MEEKKLTDEEIVQALEDMASECETNFSASVVDLIHRLQADNIQFKWNYVELKERYVKVLDLNEKVIAKQNAEIERLTEEKWKVQDDLDNYHAMLQESEKKNYELQKQVDELKEINAKYLESIESVQAGRCRLRCELTGKAVKDTAKEILGLILAKEFEKGDYLTDDELNKLFKERYGVEVE